MSIWGCGNDGLQLILGRHREPHFGTPSPSDFRDGTHVVDCHQTARLRLPDEGCQGSENTSGHVTGPPIVEQLVAERIHDRGRQARQPDRADPRQDM